MFWAACLVIIVTVVAVLGQAAAAGPLLWVDPAAGGGAAWAAGLKAWLGICRFGLAGSLVVQQHG